MKPAICPKCGGPATYGLEAQCRGKGPGVQVKGPNCRMERPSIVLVKVSPCATHPYVLRVEHHGLDPSLGHGLLVAPGRFLPGLPVAPGCVSLTAEGRGAAHLPERSPSVKDLQESLCRRVRPPQAALLRVAIKHYPKSLTRDDLAAEAGVSVKSSAFERHMATLRNLGLIDYPADRMVAATPTVFMEA